jgi:hypothetical protein
MKLTPPFFDLFMFVFALAPPLAVCWPEKDIGFEGKRTGAPFFGF